MELTAVAFLHRERGIKGEISGESLTSHPERFAQLKRVFLTKAGETKELDVERVWDFRGSPVFKFKGVDTMTDAEKLRGYEVSIPDTERVELDPGETFLSDLIGCRLSDRAGKVIGTVTGFFENGPQAVLEVAPEDSSEGDGSVAIMIPFVKAFFPEVDLAAKTATVELPDGLLELNRR